MSEKSVIIVAGGSGVRMGVSTPKQFLLLQSKPILFHTIEKFYNYDSNIEIVVVLPKAHVGTWTTLCKNHSINIYHKIVEGGAERFFSVKNGLSSLSCPKWVAIHDGVRPIVSVNLIDRCFKAAIANNSAVPVINPSETVRFGSLQDSKVILRDNVFLVQTPQVFNYELIKKAYDVDYNSNFTDDASVYEHSGNRVLLIEGEPTNIKITKKSDVDFCDFLLSQKM
ncbi:MAG TPA: 2-C-methyl-D-erythritol 4-phosphate cytidylyltransferase [Salinivirgaceae bacterium]|nr:2-C-methyl-D-erythritol 4-phosphate cytidylyltransferase [Salinivirgaceae bacterium]